MPTNKEILDALDADTLEHIERLAGANLAPNEIAVRLSINKADFMRVWRDKTSAIREAYEAGIMHIEEAKAESIEFQMRTGSAIAVQIHDKKAREAEFEAAKQEIFEL